MILKNLFNASVLLLNIISASATFSSCSSVLHCFLLQLKILFSMAKFKKHSSNLLKSAWSLCSDSAQISVKLNSISWCYAPALALRGITNVPPTTLQNTYTKTLKKIAKGLINTKVTGLRQDIDWNKQTPAVPMHTASGSGASCRAFNLSRPGWIDLVRAEWEQGEGQARPNPFSGNCW